MEATIIYPSQASYRCPVCELCYSVYSSWTRHLSTAHAETEITLNFKCDACDRSFVSRRAVANHHSKIHGKSTSPSRRSTEEAGAFQCSFCQQRFPSKRSVAQHIRNQHPAEASEQRATQAANWEARYWTPREHQLFLDALAKFGPSSNVKIANYIETKTCKQVGMHKRIFMRDNPGWTRDHANSTPDSTPQPEDLSERLNELSIPARSPNSTAATPEKPADDSIHDASPSPSMSHDDSMELSPSTSQVPPQSINQSLMRRADDIIKKLRAPAQASILEEEEPEAPAHDETEVPAREEPEVSPSEDDPLATEDLGEDPSPDVDHASGNWNDRMKEATSRREDRMKAFMEQTANLTKRVLSEEEWSQFVNAVDGLTSDLKELIASKPRRHPTSNWKKRQRRRPPGRSRDSQQSQSTPRSSPQSPDDVDSSRQSASDNSSQRNTRGSQQHKRSDRRRRAREASKYQRWYKANKKRCIRNICGDDSPRCEIPLKDLENHFSDPLPQPPTGPPPVDLPQAEGAFDADELSQEVTAEEVKSQLKRLPAQSSPGPDGIPYFVRRTSEVAPDLGRA